MFVCNVFFFFKQKTAYEMRISDWSSDVCSSDLQAYNIARESMSPSAAAAQLGFIGLAQFLPLFLLTPVTGWMADRFDRRYIARCTLALQIDRKSTRLNSSH